MFSLHLQKEARDEFLLAGTGSGSRCSPLQESELV